MSIPAQFRAFRIHGDTGPDGSGGYRSGIETISLDDLNPGEVVVRTAYSSVNYKDALAGTWSAEFEYDGTITWTFDGKGKCTMENAYMKQNGTYTIEGDQLTVTLEAWSDPSTYTFSVDGNSLTMNENSGYGISGTFTKK